MNTDKSVSFVIPVYGSESSIESVIDNIAELKLADWEVILINDNSPDNVESKILELKKKYPNNLKYYRLCINKGQHNAILTAFRYVSKDIVITIDDDGQNPPIEAIKLVEELNRSDFDVVYGIFETKKHSIFRRLASSINHRISKYSIGNRKDIPITNVRAIRSDLVKILADSEIQYQYIDGLIFHQTSRIGSKQIVHRERSSGQSGYSLKKLVFLWIDQTLGYSSFILKFVSGLSLIISITLLCFGTTYGLTTINNPDRPTGWLSLYFTITLLFSFLFLLLGLMSAYITRLYHFSIFNRKQYVRRY